MTEETRRVALCRSSQQCVAVCCSEREEMRLKKHHVLQCVAVRCTVLWCVAVREEMRLKKHERACVKHAQASRTHVQTHARTRESGADRVWRR